MVKVHTDPHVQLRLRVLAHYHRFGWRSTCHAFEIGKSTLYRWQQTYLSSQKNAASLKKHSTRPHTVRPMQVHPQVIAQIKLLRDLHYRLGKEKLKPLLDSWCLEQGYPVISVSTIGKVIHRHHLFFQRHHRAYHDPGKPQRQKPVRQRVRYSTTPKQLGHLQLDTVVKFHDGLKRYALSCMDTASKFSLTLVYPSLTSATALDTLMKFQLVYPIPIKSVQTDNGLEFQGVFEQYLTKHSVPHYFTYPRCPKINAHIERYNRTVQEEFLDPNLDLLFHYPHKFHAKLLEYLLFFNTQRVHKGIRNLTPMDFVLKETGFSQKWATYTIT